MLKGNGKSRLSLVVAAVLVAASSLLAGNPRPGPSYGAYGHIGYRGQTQQNLGAGFHAPYGYHPNWTSPGYLYSRPWYTPPVDPYVPLTNQERYRGALDKGHRAVERGDWKKAVAQYQDAQERASKFWGAGSKQAQEAGELLAGVHFKARLRPEKSLSGRFEEALERGHRARRRGDSRRAIRFYREAMRRAQSSEQAAQAKDFLESLRKPSGNWTVSRLP